MTRTANIRLDGALSVDVEEYFHATVFDGRIPRSEWEARAGRGRPAVERLLERFHEWDVKATFFVLGWFAERNRSVVREIVAEGHEIGSHGWDHRLVYDLGPDKFREEALRSRELLCDISGTDVAGYRAATFSITKRSLWALPILAESGYRFDSSVFPIHHDRYGIPEFPTSPVVARSGDSSIVEVPMSTISYGAWNLPVSGGGYLRLLPFSLLKRGIARLNREGRPFSLYVHPWEIDTDQPRVPLPFLPRFRHYAFIHRVEDRMRALIDAGNFGPVGELVRQREKSLEEIDLATLS